MRIKGTIYDSIGELPADAKPVSIFARDNKMQVGHVYMKYKRYTIGYKNGTKGPYPGYIIRSFNGMNYVIPSKND